MDHPTFPTETLRNPLAEEAIEVISRLRDAGFEAVLAGGCVRDALLGRQPKDFDVATDATPEAVREVFGRRRTLAFGASFGVIGVLPRATAKTPTEVATFRADGTYSDGRRPDSVHYGDMRADALRRDFTINGMFYDPIGKSVLDFVGGQEDLAAQRLRTIGEATARFGEDKLRMLRAVRFATTLGFQMESETMQAIRAHASEMSVVSQERIGAEMRRVLISENVADGLNWLVETGLDRVVWPQLGSRLTANVADVIARRLPTAQPGERFDAALAIVLLSLHEQATRACEDLQDLAQRWRLSNEEVRRASAAIEHTRHLDSCHDWPWSRLQPLLIDRDIEIMMEVAVALVGQSAGITRAQDELRRPADSLDPPVLISGDDLITAGYQPGPHFRDWLAELRRRQLDGHLTSREQAWQWVRQADQHRDTPC